MPAHRRARAAARKPKRAAKPKPKPKPKRTRKAAVARTCRATWKKATRGARAERRVAAEYRAAGWQVKSVDGAGADFRMTRAGRARPLYVEVKTSAGKLEPHQKAMRRRVGRANYRVEWRATRRTNGTRRPGPTERNRDARATRSVGGRARRNGRGSITWQ